MVGNDWSRKQDEGESVAVLGIQSYATREMTERLVNVKSLTDSPLFLCFYDSVGDQYGRVRFGLRKEECLCACLGW